DGGRIVASGTSEGIVREYLATAATAKVDDVAPQIAALPVDPVFRLRSVVVSQDGRSTTSVITGRPLEIDIEYDVLSTTAGLHVYCCLYNSDGAFLFETLHNGHEEKAPIVADGSYVSRAIIPAELLNAGAYRLEISAAIANIRLLIPRPIRVALDVHAGGT